MMKDLFYFDYPNVWAALEDSPKPVVLYGMGNAADRVLDEFDRVIEFGVEVMGVDVKRKTNLFDFNGMLIFSGFFFSFSLLKAVFSVVHDFADRRIALGSNLDEIEILLLCDRERLFCGHDTELLTVRANDS